MSHLFSFLVPPGKHAENPEPLQGTPIPSAGNLYTMLDEVFKKSELECCIPIRFKGTPVKA